MSLDADAAWSGIVVAAITLVGGGWAVLRVFIRHEIAEIRDNTRQLRTNGGTHLADAVNRIEATVNATEAKTDQLGREVSELKGAFTEHLRHGD